MKSIIYPNADGNVIVVSPNEHCGLAIEDIARKDVPAELPYLIIENSSLPTDFMFYSAWEADFSNPHGSGIGQPAWFIEQYEAEIAAINAETSPATPEPLVAASREDAGIPADFSQEDADVAYESILNMVAAVNAQNTEAHAQAVFQWEASKANRIEQLNKMIAVQQAELEAT